MTEQSLESGGQSGGNPASPNAEASQTGGVSTSAEQVPVTREEYNRLLKEVKALQSEDRSVKDKAVKNVNERIGKLEESVNPLLERAAQFIANGDSVQDAVRKANSEYEDADTKAALRELALAWKSGTLLNQGTGNVVDNSVAVAKAFESLGLDTKDPRVAPYLVKTYKTPEEAELAAYRLQRELAQSPQPNPAQGASMQGGSPAKSSEALVVDFRKEMLAAPRGRAGAAVREAIKAKYAQQGVPVDQVIFS